VKATPPARALAWLVDFLDRWWGPLVLGAVVAFEALVFAPRGAEVAMLAGGGAGGGAMVVWLFGRGG